MDDWGNVGNLGRVFIIVKRATNTFQFRSGDYSWPVVQLTKVSWKRNLGDASTDLTAFKEE